MAKLLYGWAHLFCLFDICRRKRMDWQSTGGGSRKAGTRRIWVAIMAWNLPTSVLWVVFTAWRMQHYGIAAFSVMLVTGLFASMVTAMTLLSRRNYAHRTPKEAVR
jgi:cellulose synthase (UDP-forming)